MRKSPARSCGSHWGNPGPKSGHRCPLPSPTDARGLVIDHILALHPPHARYDRLLVPEAAAGYRVRRIGFSSTAEAMLARIIAERPDLLMLDFVILDEVAG